MQEFPQMLYRVDRGPKVFVLGVDDAHFNRHRDRLRGLMAVSSAAERDAAFAAGWAADPYGAANSADDEDKHRQRIEFCVANWQYWLTTMIAIASVIAASASAVITWIAHGRPH